MAEKKELEKLVKLYKTMGDLTRMRILYTLSQEEKMSVNKLAESLDMTISAISHQLKTLKDNRLVKSQKDGKFVYYSIDDEHVQSLISVSLHHINERPD